MNVESEAVSLSQFPNGNYNLVSTLNALIVAPNLKRFRIAVAFASWDGIGLITENLEEYLKNGGQYQTIFGVENGVTTPDALLHCLYLDSIYPKYSHAAAIEPRFGNSLFHTKLFDFKYSDKRVVIVGSANLTGGGLERNTEFSVRVDTTNQSTFANEIDEEWLRLKKTSTKITAPKIQSWAKSGASGSEKGNAENSESTKSLPYLKSKFKKPKKPVFLQFLGKDKKRKKTKILKSSNVLSQKPAKLYLEILPYETGGSGGVNGSQGYQVQLPVAVLSAYFSVGKSESREITVKFPSDEVVTTLTHFSNNTHRIRLKPILKVKRPNILVFDRIGDDVYRAKFVGPAKYKSTLKKWCTEQSRAGARRWGMK